jgi:hypothetical protein
LVASRNVYGDKLVMIPTIDMLFLFLVLTTGALGRDFSKLLLSRNIKISEKTKIMYGEKLENHGRGL